MLFLNPHIYVLAHPKVGSNRETMIKLQNEVFPYSIGAQLVKRSKPFALNFPFNAQ